MLQNFLEDSRSNLACYYPNSISIKTSISKLSWWIIGFELAIVVVGLRLKKSIIHVAVYIPDPRLKWSIRGKPRREEDQMNFCYFLETRADKATGKETGRRKDARAKGQAGGWGLTVNPNRNGHSWIFVDGKCIPCKFIRVPHHRMRI